MHMSTLINYTTWPSVDKGEMQVASIAADIWGGGGGGEPAHRNTHLQPGKLTNLSIYMQKQKHTHLKQTSKMHIKTQTKHRNNAILCLLATPVCTHLS